MSSYSLAHSPQAWACPVGDTLSEVLVESPQDAVLGWVLSEGKERVEAISCPMKESTYAEGVSMEWTKPFSAMHTSDCVYLLRASAYSLIDDSS